nr:MAG TPA: hypothetical protein [Bacteriophage sp.]DAW45106.1 MAG TPA: hypothetical protein [Bacteriophage sp.]
MVYVHLILSVPINTILFQMVYISMIKIIIVTQKRNGHYLAKKYLMYVV